MCRVADSSTEHGYKFYQLYNIENDKATWGEIAGGGDYNETVTVTLKSTVSSSDSKLIGAVVTVKNTMTNEIQTQTWNGTPLVFKIPSVNTYTVSVSMSLASYITPKSQSYTAGINTSRNVIMTYKYTPIGIYILDTDENLTTVNNWDTANNSKAVGVYVGTDNSKFIIAPTGDNETIQWGGYGTTISGIVTSTSQYEAVEDYSGEANTDKIIAQLGTTNATAAEYCRNYTFKNGNKGYLWSLGEALDAYNNKSAINKAMKKIGGASVIDGWYYTSTQYDESYAWVFNWIDGDKIYENKTSEVPIRVVCAL